MSQTRYTLLATNDTKSNDVVIDISEQKESKNLQKTFNVSASLAALPNDAIAHIGSFLQLKSAVNLSQVNTRFFRFFNMPIQQWRADNLRPLTIAKKIRKILNPLKEYKKRKKDRVLKITAIWLVLLIIPAFEAWPIITNEIENNVPRYNIWANIALAAAILFGMACFMSGAVYGCYRLCEPVLNDLFDKYIRGSSAYTGRISFTNEVYLGDLIEADEALYLEVKEELEKYYPRENVNNRCLEGACRLLEMDGAISKQLGFTHHHFSAQSMRTWNP